MADSGVERDPLERLAEDFLERRRRGERPAVSEYVARHPERAEEVRELFSALIMVEELKPETDATIGQIDRGSTARCGRPLERLGDYRVLREVGRGGMGVVYEAEQESLGRRVALKVLAPWSHPGTQQVQRFIREARSAARLHHTNIVPIFNVGEHDGLHFYAMQLIRGLGLDEVLEEVRELEGRPTGSGTDTDTADDATASTSRGDSATVMARSLITGQLGKGTAPLPCEPDGGRDLAKGPDAPQPDATEVPLPGQAGSSEASDPAGRYACAVARIAVQAADALRYAHEQGMLHRDIKPSNLLLDGQGTVWVTDFGLAKAVDDEDLTQTGDLIGTLRYMAPERFRGRCDARSDVYALGLTLYELLALRPAFETHDRHRLIHQITQFEPPRLRWLVPDVPRDLETIVQTAIARDPADRYSTAGMLAEDLRRWLGHEPIRARPSGPWERLVKWARRNPNLAALVVVIALAVAAILTTLAVGFAQVASSLSSERRVSYSQRIALVERAWSGNDVGHAEELLDACPREFRGWEWHYLKRLCHADLLTIAAHPGLEPNAVAYSPDGARLATVGDSGAIDLRDAITGRRVRSFDGREGGVYALAFSPDGARLASAGGDGTVRLREVDTGRERLAGPPRHAGAALCVAFSPDGRRLASGSGDFWGADPSAGVVGELTIWEVDTGRAAHSLRGHAGTVHRVAFSPDGARLASAGGDGTVRLWEAATGTALRTLSGHEGAVMGVAFSPDGARLASAGLDGTLRVWGVDDGTPTLVLRDPDERFYDVAFSPDGRRLASAGRNWVVTLWDAVNGRKESTFRGHTREVIGVAFSPDGRRLASADYGGVVKVWDAMRDQGALTMIRHDGPVFAVAFSPDGHRLASASDAPGSGLRIWDVGRGRPALAPEGADEPHASVAFSPDGALLAAGGSRTGSVTLWDRAKGRAIRTFGAHAGRIAALAFSPDGRRLATGGRDRTAAVWAVATGRRLLSLGERPLAVTGVAFSPDGRSLAISTGATGDLAAIRTPGEVAICDAATGRLVRTLAGHRGGVSDLAWSPDGRRLATSSWDRSVAVWDPATGQQVRSLAIRGLIVWAIAYSPDGRLVAVDNIGRMKFWDSESYLEVLTLRGHMDRIYDLAFSPDGHLLASAGRDATVRVWDATPLDLDLDLDPGLGLDRGSRPR